MSDNAVPVGIGVISKGDIELVFELHQASHGIGARAVHANLTVVIHGHETEDRIELRIDHGNVQSVILLDRLPIANCCATERIYTDLETSGANHVHINDCG